MIGRMLGDGCENARRCLENARRWLANARRFMTDVGRAWAELGNARRFMADAGKWLADVSWLHGRARQYKAKVVDEKQRKCGK